MTYQLKCLSFKRSTIFRSSVLLALIGMASIATVELGHAKREALESFRAGTDSIDAVAGWQQDILTASTDSLPSLLSIINDGAYKLEDLGAGLSQAEAVRYATKRAADNPDKADAAITLVQELGSIRSQLRKQAESRALAESERYISHIFFAWLAVIAGAITLWAAWFASSLKRATRRATAKIINS